MSIDALFFELIRVALGSQKTLSRNPSESEWECLYTMARKHSILGICFAGVRSLLVQISAKCKESYLIGMPQSLYAQWLTAAAHIQNRNILMNLRCQELQIRVEGDGFWSCVLKGQGLAKLYGPLSDLRHCGDIDIWLWPKGNWTLKHPGRVKLVNKYLQTIDSGSHMTYHNSSVRFFDDVKVEAHYTPSWMYAPLVNRRLQQWFDEMAPHELNREFSSIEFNLIYVLLHIFRHLLGEGIGLRQCLDYYFVLLHANEGDLIAANKMLKTLGLTRFAGGLMYIMQTCLGLDEKYLLCPVDKKEGTFLLSEIMQAGNFGIYDKRLNRSAARGLFGAFWMHVSRNYHFLTHYPKEVIWCPIWKVWHQLWLRKNLIWK